MVNRSGLPAGSCRRRGAVPWSLRAKVRSGVVTQAWTAGAGPVGAAVPVAYAAPAPIIVTAAKPPRAATADLRECLIAASVGTVLSRRSVPPGEDFSQYLE